MSDKRTETSYPDQEWPQFQVSIAQPLLDTLNPQEKWLYGTIDVMRQCQEHGINHMKESQKIHILIDERIKRLEVEDRKRITELEIWREKFTWRWAVISTLGTAAVALLIARFLGGIWDHIFPHSPIPKP